MSMRAPGDVNPGAIMFAPLSMNFIAPLSTCSFGNKFWSENNNIQCIDQNFKPWHKITMQIHAVDTINFI